MKRSTNLILILLLLAFTVSCKKQNHVEPETVSAKQVSLFAGWDGLVMEAPDNQVTNKKDEFITCIGGTAADNFSFRYKSLVYELVFNSDNPIVEPVTNGKGSEYYYVTIIGSKGSYEGKLGRYSLVNSVKGTYDYYQLEIISSEAQGVFNRFMFEKKM